MTDQPDSGEPDAELLHWYDKGAIDADGYTTAFCGKHWQPKPGPLEDGHTVCTPCMVEYLRVTRADSARFWAFVEENRQKRSGVAGMEQTQP